MLSVREVSRFLSGRHARIQVCAYVRCTLACVCVCAHVAEGACLHGSGRGLFGVGVELGSKGVSVSLRGRAGRL